MIGTVIDDCYQVSRVVGEGGFGIVYECADLELGRIVALKMLRTANRSDRELKRFQAEGRNMATLNHPNVVHIYRSGQYAGEPYIVMEFVHGSTLRQMLGERPPTRRVLEIMRQVASGLAAIHAMGIVHRDLSPDNIMVTDAGHAKILDLGLSRLADVLSSMESRGYLAGTLFYVAPEQVSGVDTGAKSEVFTFAVILYEVLTGVHPFAAEHHVALLYNIGEREPEPLTAHLPDVPAALVALVTRCLSKQPERRPDMNEVERALTAILDAPEWAPAGTPARPPEPAEPMAAATPRNPYLNRVMIKRPEDFIGRRQEIKRIYARLNATPPGSISIVGDRKIGKSSLLNYVYQRSNRAQHLEHPDRSIMVFLDLQQEKRMSMETFVRTLLGIADLELRGRLDVSDCALTLDGVKDMVQRLDARGYRLGFLLDEFEVVTTNPSFSLEFFSFLRYLANHYNVSYITSSARDLQVLCHTKEISDSPFFNIFSTMRLSVFQPAEAEELVRVPSERAGKPLGAHVDAIVDMAGRFPFFLQMACSHAIEYLDEHAGAAAPDFDVVRERFIEEARLHYRYMWDSLDEHERQTLLRVAQRKSLPDSLRHVLGELENRHYVVPGDGRPKLFASTFDEFVKREGGKDGGGAKPLWKRLVGR